MDLGCRLPYIGGCYFFRLDNARVIDATIKGNESRFINHSCDPNCEVRQIRINNENKLIFFACCDIHAGDEITYDYKFPYEENEITCLCGSPNCRARMN